MAFLTKLNLRIILRLARLRDVPRIDPPVLFLEWVILGGILVGVVFAKR